MLDTQDMHLRALVSHTSVTSMVVPSRRAWWSCRSLVAPERLSNLFRRHASAGDGATAGHGLGLALSKGLVEAHGGRIRLESAGPGCGATFTFTVPVARASGVAAAGNATGPPPEADRHGPLPILVVNDDPKMLRFVSATWCCPMSTASR